MRLVFLMNVLVYAYPQAPAGGVTGAAAGTATPPTAATGAASTAPPGSGLVGQIVSAITTGIANSNIMVGSINLGQAINSPSLVATISNGINSLIGNPPVPVPPPGTAAGGPPPANINAATAAPSNLAGTGPVSNIATNAITSMSTAQLTQMTTNMANLLVQTGMTLAQQAPGMSQADFNNALNAVVADPAMMMALAGGNQ